MVSMNTKRLLWLALNLLAALLAWHLRRGGLR